MKARVLWEIDVEVEGSDVVACARDAFEAISEPGTEATVFAVFPESGQPKQVDLTLGTVEDYTPTCKLDVVILDEDGTPISSVYHQVSQNAASDIVSHAKQLSTLVKLHGMDHRDVATCLEELNDALAAAGL